MPRRLAQSGDGPVVTATAAPPSTRSGGDILMRRILRLPVDAPPGSAEGARKAFQTSLLVATFRCLLMYLVFPFVLPAIGVAKGVGPAIGLVINVGGHGVHRDEHAAVLAGRPPEALVVRRPRRHGAGVPRRLAVQDFASIVS